MFEIALYRTCTKAARAESKSSSSCSVDAASSLPEGITAALLAAAAG
jgi:hypothetical protein